MDDDSHPTAHSPPIVPSRATYLWIVRHGERIDDVDHQWVETTARPFDPPLTKKGEEQALKTGQQLKKLIHGFYQQEQPQIFLYSSPFLRTLQTAMKISQQMNHLPIKVEEGISEWLATRFFTSMPTFTASKDLKFQYGEEFCLDTSYSTFWHCKYPESIDQMAEKYTTTARTLAHQHPNTHIILVTHGYGVQFTSEGLCNDQIISEVPYCSITKLVLYEGRIPRIWNAEMVTDATHWFDNNQ